MADLDTNVRKKIALARRLFVAAEQALPEEAERAFTRYLLECDGTPECVADLLDATALEAIFDAINLQFRPSALDVHPVVAQAIAVERATFGEVHVQCKREVARTDLCDCGRVMILNKPEGLYTCSCGNSVATFASSEVRQGEQAPKKSVRRHTPATYFRETYNRITGIHDNNNTAFPPTIIEAIRGYLKRNNITLTNSPHYAAHLRTIMRALKHSCPDITKYDRYTTFIIALLYPDYPIPRLTQDQYNNVLRYFTAIIDLYSAANPGGYIRSYPYIFYKLVEILYPAERDLLKFIYIQSSSTYEHNDKLFEPFFRAALPPNYIFTPTSDYIYTYTRR